jgi:hypothetical protein
MKITENWQPGQEAKGNSQLQNLCLGKFDGQKRQAAKQ